MIVGKSILWYARSIRAACSFSCFPEVQSNHVFGGTVRSPLARLSFGVSATRQRRNLAQVLWNTCTLYIVSFTEQQSNVVVRKELCHFDSGQKIVEVILAFPPEKKYIWILTNMMIQLYTHERRVKSSYLNTWLSQYINTYRLRTILTDRSDNLSSVSHMQHNSWDDHKVWRPSPQLLTDTLYRSFQIGCARFSPIIDRILSK